MVVRFHPLPYQKTLGFKKSFPNDLRADKRIEIKAGSPNGLGTCTMTINAE
jgi:hypothetical protein